MNLDITKPRRIANKFGLALRYIEVPLPVIAGSNQVNENPGLYYLYWHLSLPVGWGVETTDVDGIIMVVVVGVIAAAMAIAIRFCLFADIPLLVCIGPKFADAELASVFECIAQAI